VLWLLQGYGGSQELKAHPPDHQDDGVHSESIHSAARNFVIQLSNQLIN
jgi:hypothetical protein